MILEFFGGWNWTGLWGDLKMFLLENPWWNSSEKEKNLSFTFFAVSLGVAEPAVF